MTYFQSAIEAASYLAAMVDGEGSIGGRGKREIRIRNTEPELIDACIEAADLLGLEYRVYRNRFAGNQWKNYDELSFTVQENLQNFQRLVPFKSKRKQELLQQALDAYTRRSTGWAKNGLSILERQILEEEAIVER